MTKRSRKPVRGRGKGKFPLRKVLFAGAFFIVGGLVGVLVVVYYLSLSLPAIGPLLEGYQPLETTRILASDGTVIGEIYEERRTVVPLAQIPDVMVNAVIAAEDADFRTHEGLDYQGMFRALIYNLLEGRRSQGASTITQQVARTFFLTREKTYSRKIREILLTKRIEDRLTKDEILYLYLNQINFGHARYGVYEATRFYFGKNIEELNLEEAALLAGIPKGPSIYSPITHPEAAKSRRAYVLGEMASCDFITEEQAEEAKKSPIKLTKARGVDSGLAPEAVKRVLAELKPVIDLKTLRRGGFTVETTLNPELQRAARDALIKGLVEVDSRRGRTPPFKASKRWYGVKTRKDKKLKEGRTYIGEVVGSDDQKGELFIVVKNRRGVVELGRAIRHNPKNLHPSKFAAKGAKLPVSLAARPVENEPVKLRLETGPEGALVAVDSTDGSILALVGGSTVSPGGFDRSTEAKRQPGSAFKPFAYLAAIRNEGYTAATLLDDSPEVQGEWKPKNSKDAYQGTVRLRLALAKSLNLPAVKLITQVGPDSVVDIASRVGITSPLEPNPSLVLGTSAVTPLEMASAFGTFARGGKYQPPWIIKSVKGPDGAEIPLSGRASEQVISEQEAFIVTSLLESVIDDGTAKAAKALDRPAAGKTGTSDDQRDAWFVGYTPSISCSVWVGFDDLRTVGRKEYGGKAALPIWIDFMKKAHRDVAREEFAEPEGIVRVQIDPDSGLLAWEGMEGAIEEVFIEGTEPTETAVPPELVDPGNFIFDQLAEDAGVEEGNEAP